MKEEERRRRKADKEKEKEREKTKDRSKDGKDKDKDRLSDDKSQKDAPVKVREGQELADSLSNFSTTAFPPSPIVNDSIFPSWPTFL